MEIIITSWHCEGFEPKTFQLEIKYLTASPSHTPPLRDEVSESVTTTDSGLGSEADITVTKASVTQSLFRHCPPVLYFPNDNEKRK